MKGLVLHCRRFEYNDIRKATWPSGVFTTKFGGSQFKDSVVVLTCVEKGDTEEYIESAVKRIIELNNTFYKRKQVIVTPFAHLSNNLEHASKAVPLLNQFKTLLQREGFLVGSASFGTDKDALFDIIGHKSSVSFFEFPFSEKPEV